MKKVFIILGIVLICTAIITIILIQPKPIVKEQTYHISKVYLDGEDITAEIEIEKLVSIITKYTRSRIPQSFAPYPESSVKIEINGIVNHEPLHILLGDINIAYSSSDKGGYKIFDSDQLLNDILDIIS